MFFSNPFGFLAIIAVPIIILMYLLKQKYKEKEVSSLYLWKKALITSKAQEPWQKLRKNMLMFLQIAAAALLTLAIAQPYFMGRTQITDYVLALDCSMSMQAKDIDGNSRLEAAKAEMLKLVEDAPTDTSFSLVLLSENPTIVLHSSNQKQTVLQAVKQAKASFGSINWNAVRTMLEAEKNALGGEVILYTDSYGRLGDFSVMEKVYQQSAENAGVTLLSYVERDGKLTVLTKVQNFGIAPQERELTLYADGVAVDTKKISVKSGESLDITFQAIPKDTESLMVRMFPEDILSADDSRFETVSQVMPKKALLITSGNVFLEKALQLFEGIELYKTTPSNLTNGYQLYIFDGFVPEEMPADGHVFLLALTSGVGDLNVGASQKISQTVRMASGAGLTDIEDMRFELAEATPLSAPWGKPLFKTGDNTTVALFGVNEGQKTVVFGFDIHDSDLPLTMGFPILLYQLLDWYFPESVTGVSSVTAEDTIDFSLQAETSKAWVETAEGNKVAIAPPFPARSFTQTQEVGIYRFVEENETNQTISLFAVNPKAIAESDLSLLEAEREYEAGETKTVHVGRSLQNAVILCLLALLLIEWRVNSHAR